MGDILTIPVLELFQAQLAVCGVGGSQEVRHDVSWMCDIANVFAIEALHETLKFLRPTLNGQWDVLISSKNVLKILSSYA